jgi:HSP20 family molecular chaperone IbpA
MSDQSQPQGEQAAAGTPQQVPVNMYETDEALVLVAPLPGVMPADVEVRVKGSTATITASMRTPAPKDYVLHEWHYGPYERAVDVPAGFAGGGDASFANGQLAVRLLRGDGSGDGEVVITPEA